MSTTIAGSLQSKPRIIINPEMMIGSGVYFVEMVNLFSLIKIGCTKTTVLSRIKDQSFCPFELKTILFLKLDDGINPVAIEKELHEAFRASHFKKEWFWASKEITDYIRKFRDYTPSRKILTEYERGVMKTALRYDEPGVVDVVFSDVPDPRKSPVYKWNGAKKARTLITLESLRETVDLL